MTPTQALCSSPNQLLALLRGQLNAREEQDLQAHLDACESCRLRLENTAAGAESWKEAQEFLGSTSDREFVEDSSVGQPNRESLQIRQVLDALGPTDEPESLGRIGGYEVSGVVGAGGMGVVLKAHDRSLDRIVAIKVMAAHLASSGTARKRFAREAKAAAAVLHPNVIAIHSVASDDACPYLVMPYVRGASLQKRIDSQGPLPLKDTLRIGSQIAAGLAAAHEQGLVHRDIKPANILLEEGVERVTITDFGLARAIDDASMTCSGVIAGTPQYMSPEQTRGEAIDARSDLFSLGSVLYAMCAGRSPFRAETTYGVLHRIANDSPTPICDVNSDVPVWLSHIIERLMAKRPDDRFDSAEQVAELLEDCLAHVQQPSTTPLPQSLATLTPQRNRRPPTGGIIAIAAFALSLIFAGVLIVLEFNKGTLTIESELDNVPIQIVQNEKVVKSLTVSREGTSTRISAGEYSVEIGQAFDEAVVKDGVVILSRGDTVIVKVTRNDVDTVASEPGSGDNLSTTSSAIANHTLNLGGDPKASGVIAGALQGFPDDQRDIKYSITLEPAAQEQHQPQDQQRELGPRELGPRELGPRELGPRKPGMIVSSGELFRFAGVPAGNWTVQAVAMIQSRRLIIGKPIKLELEVQPQQNIQIGIAFNSEDHTTAWVESISVDNENKVSGSSIRPLLSESTASAREPVAVVVVMHPAELANGNTIQRTAATNSLGLLTASDYFGILRYGFGKPEANNWLWGDGTALQRIGEHRREWLAAIAESTTGDFPTFEPAFKMALDVLKDVDARQKLMIVFTDGDPVFAFEPMIDQFREAGIKVSVIHVDIHLNKERPLLKRLADATGGTYHYALESQAAVVEGLFAREVQSLRTDSGAALQNIDNVDEASRARSLDPNASENLTHSDFPNLIPESGTALVMFNDGSENSRQMLPVAKSVADAASVQFIEQPQVVGGPAVVGQRNGAGGPQFVLIKDRQQVATRMGLFTEKRLRDFVLTAEDWLTPHSIGVSENSLVRIVCYINPGTGNVGSQYGGAIPLTTAVVAVHEDQALLFGPDSIAEYLEAGYACVAVVVDEAGKQKQLPLDIVQVGPVPLLEKGKDAKKPVATVNVTFGNGQTREVPIELSGYPASAIEPLDAYDVGSAIYHIRGAYGLATVQLADLDYLPQVDQPVLSGGFRNDGRFRPIVDFGSPIHWQTQIVKSVDGGIYGGNINGAELIDVICPTLPAPLGVSFSSDGRLIGKYGLGHPSEKDMTHTVFQPVATHSVLQVALKKIENPGLKAALSATLQPRMENDNEAIADSGVQPKPSESTEAVKAKSQLQPQAASPPNVPATSSAEIIVDKSNARSVVEAFMAAALAGDVQKAAAMAKNNPSNPRRIAEIPDQFNVQRIEIKTVYVNDLAEPTEALATSEAVRLEADFRQPDGQRDGFMVFTLERAGEHWFVTDIDFESEEGADEELKRFLKTNPNSIGLPPLAKDAEKSR